MNFSRTVRHYIQREHLFSNGDKILVAVSGGPDSVALLHCLAHLSLEFGWKLHVAHLNHHLRKEADSEADFVRRLADLKNLPITFGHWRHRGRMKVPSLEERARENRVNFLNKTAKKIKADAVALAHHEDDLAETVLMRILRGCGLQGISGILPKRFIDEIFFVRPFLCVTKAQILKFIKKNGIEYCTDASNQNQKIFRNKIRHHLMPLLEKNYNPNIRKVLSQLALISYEDYSLLEKEARRMFQKVAFVKKQGKEVELKIKTFLNLEVALKRMILRLAIEMIKGSTKGINFLHLNEIEDLLRYRSQLSLVQLPHQLWIKKETDDRATLSKT